MNIETKRIWYPYLDMEVEVIDGKEMDARCTLYGTFVISGERRKEFTYKLENLIDEYSN